MDEHNKISELLATTTDPHSNLNLNQLHTNNLIQIIDSSSNTDEISDKLAILKNASNDTHLDHQISTLEKIIEDGVAMSDIKSHYINKN